MVWQPIATCPRDVRRALLAWPALKLDEAGGLTNEPAGESLVGIAHRHVNGGWEELDPALEATGEYFGDDWEYGAPTHWMPLPSPPFRLSAPEPVDPCACGHGRDQHAYSGALGTPCTACGCRRYVSCRGK